MSTGNWPAIGSGSTGGHPPAPPTEHEHWWRFAHSVAERLRHGQLPPPIQVFGPVLWPGEQAYFQADVTYARMYGGDGRYYTHSLMALGSWKFMAGAYAINGYLNHRRKKAAEREATVSWRDHQRCSIIATDHRILVNVAPHGWTTFGYDAISEYYPDVLNQSLVLGFDDISSSRPIRAQCAIC